MQIKEIILVIVISIPFIVMSILTKRMKPKPDKRQEAKWIRISLITISILFLLLIWIGAPSASVYPKLILSAIAVLHIFSNLKGWVLK